MLDDKRAKAKIENIPIYITSLTTTGGVRTQKVAFHNSNEYHLEGYGANGREFSVKFQITSEDTSTSIEKLTNSVLDILNKKAPFLFTDPFLGKLKVLCSSYSFNLHILRGEFSCTFQELPSKKVLPINKAKDKVFESTENFNKVADKNIHRRITEDEQNASETVSGDIANLDDALTDSVGEPRAPGADEPATPTVVSPEGSSDEPQTPVADEPATPTVVSPEGSGDEPQTPVADEPATPTVVSPEGSSDEPQTPVADEPQTPVADEPATPTVVSPEGSGDEPQTPVADEPQTPVADEPATPTVVSPESSSEMNVESVVKVSDKNSIKHLAQTITNELPGFLMMVKASKTSLDDLQKAIDTFGENKSTMASDFAKIVETIKNPKNEAFSAHKKILDNMPNIPSLKVVLVGAAIKEFTEGLLLRRDVPMLTSMLYSVGKEVLEKEEEEIVNAFNEIKYQFYLFLKEKKPILDGQQDVEGDGAPLIVRYYDEKNTTSGYENLEDYNKIDDHLFFSNNVVFREV